MYQYQYQLLDLGLVSACQHLGKCRPEGSWLQGKEAHGRGRMQEMLWKVFALRTERLWEHSVGLLLFYVVGQPLLEVGGGDRIPLKLKVFLHKLLCKLIWKKRLQI